MIFWLLFQVIKAKLLFLDGSMLITRFVQSVIENLERLQFKNLCTEIKKWLETGNYVFLFAGPDGKPKELLW